MDFTHFKCQGKDASGASALLSGESGRLLQHCEFACAKFKDQPMAESSSRAVPELKQKMPSPYLWPPAPVPRSSASRSFPFLFAAALAAFPGAELNFSRPMAGDTKTKEFEKVAT